MLANLPRPLLARILFVGGIAWFVYQLALYNPGPPFATVFNRYSTNFFILLCFSIIALLITIITVSQPVFRELILGNHFRLKIILLAGWLPAITPIYILSYKFLPYQAVWNSAFGGFFWLWTGAILIVSWDALMKASQQPELWITAGSLVIAVIAAEFAMRYYMRHILSDPGLQRLYDPAQDYQPLVRYAPHHYMIYRMNPRWESADGKDYHNSLGFRGEEIESEKPEGVFRIVAVGGSTTYGTGVTDWREAYPPQLEEVLREEYGYSQVEVINGGIPGYTSWEIFMNVQFFVLELEPDLIIFYENTNDVHPRFVPPELYRSDNSAYRKAWDQELLDRTVSNPVLRVPSSLVRFMVYNFSWFGVTSISLDNITEQRCTGRDATSLTETCLGVTPDEALTANPPEYYERNIRSLIAIAHANDTEVLLLTWAYSDVYDDYATLPFYRRGFTEQNRLIKAIAQDTQVPLYDLQADMPPDIEYWKDNRHYSALGSRLQAELIAKYIDEADLITTSD